jgi:hypothetical protein
LLLLLGVNGLGLTIMWMVQFMVQVPITPGNIYYGSPWDELSQVSTVKELGVLAHTYFSYPHVRIEWSAYSVATVCFAVLIGTSLYRLRPWRPRLHWRLRTAMLIIAFLAVEYSLAVFAWDLKDKWNKCFIMANYWEEHTYKITPKSGREVREWEQYRSEKEHKYRWLLWNPWRLAFVTWDQIKWKEEDGHNVFIDLPGRD